MNPKPNPLRSATLFADLTDNELLLLEPKLVTQHFTPDTEIVREGSLADTLYVIVEGQVRVHRGPMELSVLEAGDSFGELGLLSNNERISSVWSLTGLTTLRLDKEALEDLRDESPEIERKIMATALSATRNYLINLSSTLSKLLQDHARPLRTEVTVKLPDRKMRVRAGTQLKDLLPSHIGGEPVVAANLDNKITSLNSTLHASASLDALTPKSREGRAVYRRSLGMVLLEAAYRVDRDVKLRIGPSLGFAHIVEIEDDHGYDHEELAQLLTDKMNQIIVADTTFRRERWKVGEANAQFAKQGWEIAAKLLRAWRNSTVPLVSCGELHAIEIGPMVGSTSCLKGFELVVHNDDFLLYFGDFERRSYSLVQAAHPGQLAREHERWLNTMGATSVGAINDIIVDNQIDQVIRVSEGHHEKRISQIAEEVFNHKEPVRVICISGPSSSGKTTFLKRLSVQLQVVGLTPRCLSLDNYYVDREFTVKDANGEYDFEAFEALNRDLLADHLNRLIRGETVATALYNFGTGINDNSGGPVMTVGPRDVLLLEGIHALNPRLPIDDASSIFRIFINPMTSLPLDHVNRVSVSDIRLVRRIVRDRNQRNITAADNIMRWPSVGRGERLHIFPYQESANAVFNSSLIYEPSVLKIYAERYLLEVPTHHPAYPTAHRLRRLIDKFVAVYPGRVPANSLLREFIGGLKFEND